MTAILGRWTPPNQGVWGWCIDWRMASGCWTSPRKHLAEQLRYLRLNHGTHEASEFRNYLLWLSLYPIKKR
jgi:hypothetical protein